MLPPQTSPPDVPPDELLTRCLADVRATRVRWLWQGRIAKGRLALVIGHPGEGKSWLTMALAAALSLGVPLPGESAGRDPVRVLIASAEDDPGDTLRPRFDALDGDPRLVTIIEGVAAAAGERGLVVPADAAILEAELAAAQRAGQPYGLLVLDPLAAYLPGTMDSHRDVSVRAALAPLARLAQVHGVAIIAVVHLTKAARDAPMLRAQGSIAFTAAARTVLAVGRDPEDGEKTPIRHVVMVKSNVGAPAPGLMFTLEGGRFGWLGESPLEGHDLMAARPDRDGAGGTTQLLAAQAFLRDVLASGSQWSGDVDDAGAEAGFSEATLRRARQGVVAAERVGVPGNVRGSAAWYVRLLGRPALPPSTDPPPPRQKSRKRRGTPPDQGAQPLDGPNSGDSSSIPDLFGVREDQGDQGAQHARVERLGHVEQPNEVGVPLPTGSEDREAPIPWEGDL